MKKLHNKLKFIYLLLVIALFFGCGSGETAKEPGGTLTIHSPSFPEIQGMVSKVAAYLQEDFAGFNCPLTVDPDTTLSGQCSDIPNGTHTYTLKYVHKDTGVILATAVIAATMEQGQNHDITFPSPVYGGYDDDSDGYTNLLEIANGSNPKDPNSHPYDTTSPATPSLLSPTSGSSTGNDKPAFDWTDVTDPSGVSYEIQVDNDSDFSSLAINGVGLTASNYTITYPLADGTYYWRVRARDGSGNIATDGYAGNPSGWSGSWSITVSKTYYDYLSDPTGVTAAAGDGQATISWNPVSGATSYNLYWSTTSGVSKASYAGKISNVTSPYSHTGLTNGTTYYYVVTAVNSYGESNGSSQVSATPQYVSNSGLIAYYPFNGNANDASGNDYNGTVNGAILTTDRFGNANSAYSFNGTSNYISLSNTSPLNFTSGGFTLSVWVNFSNTNTDTMIIGKHSCGYGNGYFLGVGNYGGPGNIFNFFVNSDSRLKTSGTYNDGNWHLVSGVYDGATQYLYVDGVLKASQAKTYSSTNNIDISIGRASGTCGFFNGLIDDVRIYNRPLSDSEILTLYNDGGTSDTTAPSNTTGSNFINSGASSTNSTNVTLTVSATDNAGVTGYCAKESSTTPSVSDTCWTSITSTTSYSTGFDLSLSSGDGAKAVYVWFKDAAGNVSAPVNDTITLDTTSPSVPTNPIATFISDTQIDLTWTASTDTNGVAGYNIYRDGVYIGYSPNESYSDTGVTGGTTYTYTITGYDAVGNVSSQSTLLGATSKGTKVSGVISTNTTWTAANSPYIVTGNIIVDSGITLTIEAGATVKFDSLKSLQVDGTLIARGNSTNKITFTSNLSSKAAGDWGYLLFSDSSADATYDINGNYTGGSVLEYCTVEYAGGASVANNGAVRMDNAHPFINYCIIRNNGTSANGASGIGGYNLTGTLKITNNTISNNNASNLDGGGIYASGSGAVTVLYNTVSSNTASGAGGGIFVSTSGTSTISNNSVSNNTSGGGGGIYVSGGAWGNSWTGTEWIFYGGGTSTISNNTVNNNTVSGSGGGIKFDAGSAEQTNIINNAVSNNYSSGRGGGIHVGWATATISYNIVNNNTSSEHGGGIGNDYGNAISNNAIINNIAYGSGAGIYNGLTISNNIIAGNTASSSSSAGGGIYGGQTISNNTVFNNSAYYAGGIYSYTTASNNTITGNNTTGVSPVYTIYPGDSTSTLNNNNIFSNTTTYEVYNWNAQGSANLDATNNWWGSAIESQYWVYDWLDDATKGNVDYDPWCGKSGNSLCTGIRTDVPVPISPPAGLTATAGNGEISLIWTANQEGDTAGYRVYWSTVSGSPYVYSADVSGTSYTIPGLSPGTYYVTVTAYDADYYGTANDDPATIVNEKQTNGYESWYAVEKMVTVP